MYEILIGAQVMWASVEYATHVQGTVSYTHLTLPTKLEV